MAKDKRLTIRLDDELSTTIDQACRNGKCDKTGVVINALKKGLGMERLAKDNVIRIRVEGDKITFPCRNCGGPVPINLEDLGLQRI